MNILAAILQWTFLLLSNIVLDFLGLFIVALAIPFRKEGVSLSDGRPIVNLPKVVWLWGNDYDGLLGDKRGWWDENTPFGVSPTSYLAMWWWAALRNPVNNMRFVSLWSAPIRGSVITYKGDYIVEDKPGMAGWQFVQAEKDGKKWYGFYLVKQWNETRAFVIRIGFKLKPLHQGSDEDPKGMTTKINLWKAI